MMSKFSKRSNYTPARPDEKAGRRRPAISQGQVMITSPDKTRSPLNMSNSFMEGVDISIIKQVRNNAFGQSRSMCSPVFDSQLCSPVRKTKPKTDSDEVLSTPRKLAPDVSEHQSPRPTRPLHDLDVSDDDDSDQDHDNISIIPLSQCEHDLIKHSSPTMAVLVLDATRQTKTPNETEVDVRLGFKHSPIKVINHSPSVVARNLGNTGDTSQASKVTVEEVPRVLVCKNTDYTNDSVRLDPGLNIFKTPMVIREDKKIEAGDIDPNSSARLIDVEAISPIVASQCVATSHGAGLDESDAHTQKTTDVSDTCSQASDSIFSVSQSKNKNKKKAYKVVQSRYLSSSSSRPPRDTISRQQTSSKKLSSTSMQSWKKAPVSSTRRTMRLGSVPNISSLSGISGHIDISAISDSSTLYNSLTGRSMTKQFTEHNMPPRNKVKKEAGKYSAADLDAIYSRYIQWRFLRHHLEKSIKERNKHAMAQLYSLWEQVEESQNNAAQRELSNISIDMTNRLLQVLETMDEGLYPVMNKLHTFKEQHNKLGNGLDAIRHQLVTDGIYLPPDEEKYQESLLECLLDSEDLLHQWDDLLGGQETEVEKLDNGMTALDHKTSKEIEGLEACKSLLSEIKSVAIHELSLNFHAIQEKEDTTQ